ncbi:hypothetical protein [Pseudomonas sp.]|uniref:hypothetical protein n=1 Tax=Pseudomonas sp. TaxID=306 RepID=UPI0028B010BF|nr:hypothetical protein [Pseudomonas sp.]
MRKALLIVASLFVVSSACAEILTPEPSRACVLLADVGLKAGGWVDENGDGSSGCASKYQDIGSGASGLANQLEYYAVGPGDSVIEVRLAMDYNQLADASSGTAALVAASQKLALRALGANLSVAAAALIEGGQPGLERVGKGSVEVIREDWPNGQGYQVSVVMR